MLFKHAYLDLTKCCEHVNAIKNVNCNNILQTRCCLIINKTNFRRIQVLLYRIIQDHVIQYRNI